MNLYMIVTNDEYELPVKCDVNTREAAQFLNVTPGHVRKMVCNPPKMTKYKVVVTGKVKTDKVLYQKRYRMSHDRSEYSREYHRKRREKGMHTE